MTIHTGLEPLPPKRKTELRIIKNLTDVRPYFGVRSYVFKTADLKDTTDILTKLVRHGLINPQATTGIDVTIQPNVRKGEEDSGSHFDEPVINVDINAKSHACPDIQYDGNSLFINHKRIRIGHLFDQWSAAALIGVLSNANSREAFINAFDKAAKRGPLVIDPGSADKLKQVKLYQEEESKVKQDLIKATIGTGIFDDLGLSHAVVAQLLSRDTNLMFTEEDIALVLESAPTAAPQPVET